MFVNLKKFAQKLGAVKRETRSHCYRSELNQNERFRLKSDVTFAAYHIEKKRFWILRLENFERKKSQKHKYRGTQPANLAESIPRIAACGGGDARATCACRPGIAAAPCSALVAPFWRAPGERHGAPLRYPTIRRTTLGIAADSRNPRATTSDRPDTMGGSCLVPVMHWTSARRACGGVCAPLRHSRSDTGFALAASKVERSMRRCAVKLLFWHSPRYACTHPGRTILPCVLDG